MIGDVSTFNYTGAVQTMQLLAGHRYIIECFGAQGCSTGTGGNRQGGWGGYAFGEYQPSEDVTANIYVGQQPSGGTGGWNGGGNGGSSGGGGASDVRIGGTALSNRIIVAAGGGGGSSNDSYRQNGYGGGEVGGDGINWNGSNQQGRGATQSAGGSNGGTLGVGGNATDGFMTGGGGGGYYGGGGATGMACGGGGGSSWAGGCENGGTHAFLRPGHGLIRIIEVSTSALNTETTFSYTGYPQSVKLKKGKYRIACYGAQGGLSSTSKLGGKGGYCAGDLVLSQDKHLLLMVGGQGGPGDRLNSGWNGGGRAVGTAGAGGGATDVRMDGGLSANRILVAGGGGGQNNQNTTDGTQGAGGGLTGNDGVDYYYGHGHGGTQYAGGVNGGAVWKGVDADLYSGSDAGGAGGGYYGGGVANAALGGGGGGSSYYGTLENAETEIGVNTGNGYIVITPLSAPYAGCPQII